MVDSAANMLLETLRDVLIEEVKFLSEVGDEVKKVETDLKTIHGLLMEADRDRSDSPTLKNCIAELKELAFKAENVLETYAVEVEAKKEGKSLKKKLQRFIGILCECYSVHQVGNEIDDIRSRLADLTGKLSSISRGEVSSNSAGQEQRRLLRLRYAHEVEQHFVGMEKDIERLVSMVMDEPRRSASVISICGMGGLGKTTLARKVYHHQDIQGRFDCRAWVCVTQQFQAETIFREIFKQVDNERAEINNMGLTELVPGLYSVLEQRKCLIVIDDIWESCHWGILKPAFPTNCKVVLTTRNKNITSQECDVYELGSMSVDEGWELLGKIAFPINADATPGLVNRSKSFEDIGRQMVQKCGRLPLAISVIGGILRQKQELLGEWEKVSSNIDSYLKRGEGIGNDTGVKLILDLSFDVLPYYLKPCFLYLACFPEDQEINTDELYLLWMGEGLISLEEKGNNESLRDVAKRYLTELAFRCMIEVERRENNKFESCRLHDLMRDLCSSKAEEEKFLKRIDISKHQHHIPSFSGASIHRVAINLDDGDATSLCKSCMQEVEDLRSFLVLCKNPFRLRRIHFENIVNLENAKHVRILVLDRFEFEGGKLPSTIGKLIHLRYLSLCYCNVEELPEYVCDLPYLQTLNLWVNINGPMKLPNLIWKMKRLRHLYLRGDIEVIGGDKLRLDGLDELETLERIHSKTACVADIINLTNLRRLTATIEEDMDSLSRIADYMMSNNNGCQLRETEITVKSCDFGSGEEGRNVVKKMLMSPSLASLNIMNCEIGCGFPCYEQGMCHNLASLGIFDSKIGGDVDVDVDVDVVEELEKYPILQKLWFRGKEQVMKTEMRFGANSFPELKMLYLGELLNLKKWEVEKGAMPKLRELTIFRCSNLAKLPDGLRFIPTLGELRCFHMSEELKGRMRRGGVNGEGESAGQDYANFSHISYIHIE